MLSNREQRGVLIATTMKISKRGDCYLVPSQSCNRKYSVFPEREKPFCSCPDHEATGQNCKHIFAALYTIQREKNPDGTETVTETLIVQKTTYQQDWPNYNAAQTTEKEWFRKLLAELCKGVKDDRPRNPKGGQQRIPLADALFAVLYKVYSTFSGRRFMTDLRDAHAKGFIGTLPCYNSIFTYLEDESLTPILQALVTQASLPLAAVETEFAIDSSGFGTQRFFRWYDHKYGVEREEREWVKCHICTGVKTNVVTAVAIYDRNTNDSPIFPELLEKTAESFAVDKVSADKGYCGDKNAYAVEKIGGVPFIAFKSGATGAIGGAYGRMFHFFQFKKEEFLKNYHRRSNVESTFSAVKRLLGDFVRSKTDVAMRNEAYAKFIAYNITCVIHAMYELGIDATFWNNEAAKEEAATVDSPVQTLALAPVETPAEMKSAQQPKPLPNDLSVTWTW
jgi:transposase